MSININNVVLIKVPFERGTKYLKPLTLVIILFLCAGNSLWAQIKVTATRDLVFGSFAAGTAGGTVVVSPQGFRSVTGSIIAMPDPFAQPAVIEVRVNGKNRSRIIYNLPPEATLSLPDGSKPLDISNFTSDIPSPILDEGDNKPRTYTINIGATLNVNTANSAGEYTGDFPVTFTFIQE